jgi:hypothetical protein
MPFALSQFVFSIAILNYVFRHNCLPEAKTLDLPKLLLTVQLLSARLFAKSPFQNNTISNNINIMPGPKMGPRPADFDEEIIRQSPTFIRWNAMKIGEKLRYACRDFVRGHGDDEERLMRRIMIARRNNLKDHQALKRARVVVTIKGGGGSAVTTTVSTTTVSGDTGAAAAAAATITIDSQQAAAESCRFEDAIEDDDDVPQPPRKRRPSTMFSDTEVAKEMDVPAVEATRSYRSWIELPNGAEFIYNQKYIKGREGHDWLLRKNIWRRMRYRRENKRSVERMRTLTHPTSIGTTNVGVHATSVSTDNNPDPQQMMASQIVDETLLAGTNPTTTTKITDSTTSAQPPTGGNTTTTPNDTSAANAVSSSIDEDYQTAVEAAVAVAESYVKSPYNVVHNPLGAAANSAALDAAARLAAAAGGGVDDDAAEAAAAMTTGVNDDDTGGNNNNGNGNSATTTHATNAMI